MAKERAQTIQQRFGFNDSDLKNATHDEIMIWLDKAVNILIEEWIGYSRKWGNNKVNDFNNLIKEAIKNTKDYYINIIEDTKESKYFQEHILVHKNNCKNNLQKLNQFVMPITPEKPKIYIEEKKWEYPITTSSQNKFIVGFADMYISYKKPFLEVKNIVKEYNYFDNKNLITLDQYKYDRGSLLPEYEITYDRSNKVFFEVKTKINSLGELIRQINMYREYVRGIWFIVSPDDKFKDQLASQNIKFIKYEPLLLEPDEFEMSDGTVCQIPF